MKGCEWKMRLYEVVCAGNHNFHICEADAKEGGNVTLFLNREKQTKTQKKRFCKQTDFFPWLSNGDFIFANQLVEHKIRAMQIR